MISRYTLLLVTAFLISTPASAQWTFLSDQGSFITTDVALRDGVLVAVCGDSTHCTEPLLVSTDAGATWRQEGIADPVAHWGRNVAATADGFVFHGGGVLEYTGTADAASWTQSAGLGANSTSYFRDPETGRLYITTQSANLGISEDEGQTWQNGGVASACDDELSFVHARGSSILTGYNQFCGSLHFSQDGGVTWTDLGVTRPSGAFIGDDGDLYVTQNVNVSLVTPSTALFRSEDSGATWTQLYAAPGRGFQGRQTPLRVRTTIYAEGSSLLFTANDRVYVSSDDGGTWTDASDGITPDDTNASAALEFFIEDGTAYLLLYSTRDRGNTSGYGLWSRPASELGLTGATGTARQEMELPDMLTLEPAYPNPFRSRTAITYHVARAGAVEISVVDVLGRVVDQVARNETVGTSTFDWDAGDLPGGTYLVRVASEGGVTAVPVVRVR